MHPTLWHLRVVIYDYDVVKKTIGKATEVEKNPKMPLKLTKLTKINLHRWKIAPALMPPLGVYSTIKWQKVNPTNPLFLLK